MVQSVRRTAAAASVSLTGVAVVAVMVFHVATTAPPTSGVLLAAFGGVVGFALAAAGYALVWLDVRGDHALRVAGWNLLGVVVIGAALALLYAYQASVASVPAAPVFSGTVVVAVSAVAHVLIGVNDVRRIRAAELARERQKLDVLSRVMRHNLRHHAQLLVSYASRTDDPALGEDIRRAGEDLSALHEHGKLVRSLVGADVAERPVALAPLAESVVAEHREVHPDAEISVSVPEDVAVEAGDYLREAVTELVTNAVEHADGAATVAVSASVDGDRVALTVRDDGPGIPAMERRVVTGDTPITKLEHGSGLGLWVVRWVADAYGATLDFDVDETGSAVTLSLRRA